MASPPRSPPYQDAIGPLPLPAPPEKPADTRLDVPTKLDSCVTAGDASVTRAVQAGESRAVSGILRRDRLALALRRTAVALRAVAGALSLIAFSLMASDKTQGWAGDSFDRYVEYKYLVSVNVIVFVYSGIQLCAHLHLVIKKKSIIHPPISLYFDLTLDQALAYLLMSASSSAATRNNDWVTSFGSDAFTKRASSSIAMSFLTFFPLAFSSLISAHHLFTWYP
ncbi:putative casparian strip membrane protein [Dioscorea sansibarensis]